MCFAAAILQTQVIECKDDIIDKKVHKIEHTIVDNSALNEIKEINGEDSLVYNNVRGVILKADGIQVPKSGLQLFVRVRIR